MDSRSASGPQQVGTRLRRSLCSDRRNPGSDLLRPPGSSATRTASAISKPWPWHMLLLQGAAVQAPSLGLCCCTRGGALVSFRLVVGIQGPEVPSDETRHFCCKSQARTLETSDRH